MLSLGFPHYQAIFAGDAIGHFLILHFLLSFEQQNSIPKRSWQKEEFDWSLACAQYLLHRWSIELEESNIEREQHR